MTGLLPLSTRAQIFNGIAGRLYKNDIKSHALVYLSQMIGENRSSASVMLMLRRQGVVQPGPCKVGKWSKRHGPNLGEVTNAGMRKAMEMFPNSGDMRVRLRWGSWKDRMSAPLLALAQNICRWVYWQEQTGKEIDLDAIANKDEPP